MNTPIARVSRSRCSSPFRSSGGAVLADAGGGCEAASEAVEIAGAAAAAGAGGVAGAGDVAGECEVAPGVDVRAREGDPD